MIVNIVGEDDMLDLMAGIKEKDEKGDKKLVQVSAHVCVRLERVRKRARMVLALMRTHAHAPSPTLSETQKAWEGWELWEDTRRAAEGAEKLRADVREITEPGFIL